MPQPLTFKFRITNHFMLMTTRSFLVLGNPYNQASGFFAIFKQFVLSCHVGRVGSKSKAEAM